MSLPSLHGRALVLFADPELVQRQLEGEVLTSEVGRHALLDAVSTDEMAPGWASYYFDERLGRYCLVGLRGGVIPEGAIADGGFEVLVGGEQFGCGSSRETAPFAQLVAGIRLVVARSFGRIYAQNCRNIGLFTSQDFGLLERMARGERLELSALVAEGDTLAARIERAGGLLAYARARARREIRIPAPASRSRPQTLVEKIVASHAVRDDGDGVASVAPGDSLFVRADLRFSHEYVTPMADALFRRAFGEEARVREPGSVLLFRDHLTFVSHVLARDPKKLPLLEQAELLPVVQARFAARHGIRLLGEVEEAGVARGSQAICHEEVLETFAEPGMLVVGTDSHTSTAGALGCVAFGVGSTDMAAAFFSGDVRLEVPETVRVTLTGELPLGTCAKDVMLTLFDSELVRSGRVTGRVLEFGGPGLSGLCLDERATLTNLAVEAGAFTGIVEVDGGLAEELAALRGAPRERWAALRSVPDAGASYAAEVSLDLSRVVPMVALPGDPRNVLPVSELERTHPELLPVDIAYAGSCTGGKRRDMDYYAQILAPAAARGARVSPRVRLYLQFGSQRVRRHAVERGQLQAFERVGAQVLDPACGACIGAGPGVSSRPSEVTISAGSRNFPGRSGPGRVLLASPLVVAASALAGYVTAPRIEPERALA